MKTKHLLSLIAFLAISTAAISELYAETVKVNCTAGNTCCVYGGEPLPGKLHSIEIIA
jgi:hypothetical protein